MVENVESMIADELARVSRFIASCENEVAYVANQLHTYQMHMFDKLGLRVLLLASRLIVKYDLETVVIYRVNPEAFEVNAEIIGRNTPIESISPYVASTYGGKPGLARLLNTTALLTAIKRGYIDVASKREKWIIDTVRKRLEQAKLPIEDYVIVRKTHVEDGKIRVNAYDLEKEFFTRTEDVGTRKYHISFSVIALYPEYGREEVGVTIYKTPPFLKIDTPIVEDEKYVISYVISKYVVDHFGELVRMGVEQIIRYAEFFSHQS